MPPKNATSFRGDRTYTKGGEKVPSVTTILSAYPKPWLGGWAAKMVAERPVVTPAGAERHVAALVAWWDAYRPRVTDSEIQLWGDGYAGSCDLIADVYGRRLLIDLKTSGQLDASMSLQLAAYRYADEIFHDDKRIAGMPIVDGCAVLWIPRDHPDDWQFVEMPVGATEYALFRSVMAVWQYHKDHDKEAGGTLILPQVEEVA